MLEDPSKTFIAMEIDHVQSTAAEYLVPIIVKIPGRELAWPRARRRRAIRD